MSTTTLKQHVAYSKSPTLFMSEKWLAFDVFETKNYKNIKPFDYQLDIIKKFHEIDNHIIVKSRQMHVSSMVELYIAWYLIFNYDKTVSVISHSHESARNIVESVRIILQNYSVTDVEDGVLKKTYFHWEDDFIKNNKSEIALKNNCRIIASGPSSHAGKGWSPDFCYIDEAAYVNYFQEIFFGVGMSMSTKKNSKFIIASTPKDNSFFNSLYLTAESGSFLNPTKLHWSIHPIYSKDIKEEDADSPFKYSSPWFYKMFNTFNNDIKTAEQELECVVRYKNEVNKTKTISLRMDGDLHKKLQDKLNPGVSISDYIRTLIEKDLEN